MSCDLRNASWVTSCSNKTQNSHLQFLLTGKHVFSSPYEYSYLVSILVIQAIQCCLHNPAFVLHLLIKSPSSTAIQLLSFSFLSLSLPLNTYTGTHACTWILTVYYFSICVCIAPRCPEVHLLPQLSSFQLLNTPGIPQLFYRQISATWMSFFKSQ